MWNLANLKNVNFLKRCDELRHWIDYLRLNFIQPIKFFEDKLRWLVSNSNFIVEDWFTYTKITLGSGLCVMVTYSYNNISFPVLLYNVFSWNGIYKKYARMDFYWTFFRLIEIGEFPKNYFLDYVKNLTDENPTISRIDYCFDLFHKTPKNLPQRKTILKEINSSTKWYINTTWNMNTSRSYGSKTNKRYIVRMYDKLLDILSKNKQFIYTDYLKYDSVHRFEVEFWPKFCRWYSFDNFNDLLQKTYSYLWINNETFTGSMFYQYSSKYEISERNKTQYIKKYLGQTKKLFDAWFNPHTINLLGLCVHTQTKYDKKQHAKYLKQLFKKAKTEATLKEYLS